jgi:hypothetical protein
MARSLVQAKCKGITSVMNNAADAKVEDKANRTPQRAASL